LLASLYRFCKVAFAPSSSSGVSPWGTIRPLIFKAMGLPATI
jgi:hypothetical protein